MDDYADDPTILDEDGLWRRIPPRHLIFDENLRCVRPTSAAFEDHPNGTPMSVLLEKTILREGRGPEDAVQRHEGFSLGAITAGLARECRQRVARDPLPDEPAHALVCGKKTKGVRRTFAKQVEWVIPPPDRVAREPMT